MECRDDRDAEGPDEVEDVRAVVATPDAEIVLETDDADAGVIEILGHVRVIGLDVAPDSAADFSGVRAGLAKRVKSHDLAFADRRSQVVCEGSDAASSRDVGGNEGSPRDGGSSCQARHVRTATRRLKNAEPAARRVEGRATSAESGLGCADLNGARALGARLDFE